MVRFGVYKENKMNGQIDCAKIAREKIRQIEEDEIKKIFPNATFSESSFLGSPNKQVNSFQAYLSSENLFKDTPYENDGTSNFLHFTSLPALSQILNSGFIRMSDFECLSDKTEIDFAKNFYFSNDDSFKQTANKSRMFCLSACEYSNDTILNNHMWQVYADKGKGCAIEYKFSSNDIFNMSFGKIQYGKKKITILKTLRTKLEQFSKNNEGFSINNLSDFLTPIFAFHKDIKFKKENEIRLFYFQNGAMTNKKDHLNQYSDFYKSDQVRNFIKIYLKGKNPYQQENYPENVDVLKLSPQIEISRIFLGPDIANIYKVIEKLKQLKKQLNLDFEVWRVSKNELNELNMFVPPNAK